MNYYTGKTGQDYYDMRAARRDEFLQKRRASHFQPFITENDIVLDFGCGTGGVLAHIQCAKKLGIEVNTPSVAEAKEKGIEVHDALSAIPDNSIDIVMSNHALEHVTHPAEHITEMHRVLKPGGKVILVVPAENASDKRFSKWVLDDPDQHIYSWTPLSFANLIAQCGFKIENSVRRPIGYSKYIRFLANVNEALFQLSRRMMAFILRRYEVACVARKP